VGGGEGGGESDFVVLFFFLEETEVLDEAEMSGGEERSDE